MKPTKTLTLAILFTALSSISTWAAFEAGYVVTSKNDTLRGQILVEPWLQSPQSVSFRANNSATTTTYTTADIRLFHVLSSGETYTSKTFEIEHLLRDISKPSAYNTTNEYLNRKTDKSNVTAFVRVISTGNIDLYIYNTGRSSQEHYLVEKNGRIEALVYHRLLMNGMVREFKHFQQALNAFTADNSALAKKINETDYQEYALKTVIDTYNKTFGGIALKKSKSLHVAYGGLLKIGNSSWNNNSPSSSLPSSLMSSVIVCPGVFVSLKMGKRNSTVNVFTDAYYYSFKGNLPNIRTRGYDVTYSITTQEIRFLHGLQFEHRFEKISAYAEVGFGTIIPLKQSFTESYIANRSTITLPFASFNAGSNIGVGVAYKGFAVGLRMGNKSTAYAPVYGQKASFSTHALVFKYDLASAL